MHLTPLSVTDKKLFDAFLQIRPHSLAAYSFENIFSWSGLYDVSWAVVDDALCVYYTDATGCFLYLPPLGARISPDTVAGVCAYLARHNRYPLVARIENIEPEDVCFYRDLGYNVSEKFGDYVYRRNSLAALQGDRFKSQRASLNYCAKHYRVSLEAFSADQAPECLALYQSWADKKKKGQ